jgi:hypothetical protein
LYRNFPICIYYPFTLWATFTAFLKLILDNPFQTRMVAKFPNGFSLSFFSLRRKIKLGGILYENLGAL